MGELLNVTMGDLLDKIADRYPNNQALIFRERGLRLDYQRLKNQVNQAAKGLMSLSVQKGEHIAIWAANLPEWPIIQFASGKMGAVLVTVNTNYRSFELEYVLNNSDVTTLILMGGHFGVDYLEMLRQICPELVETVPGQLNCPRLPKLKNIIYLGPEIQPGMFNWAEVLAKGKEISDEELAARQNSLKPDDVINMQYTSGTTGFPKGVMLTHNNIINNANYVGECMNFTHEDRLCIPVPLFHCFGCVMSTLLCLTKGAAMVLIEHFKAHKVLEAIQAEKCTAVHGVPTMYIAELEVLKNHPYELSSLRTGIMAGSPCPIELMKQVVNKMGMQEITIAYGLTEFSPVITQTRTSDPINIRVTTVGRAIPNVEVKIVDPENGQEVPIGMQGELCARGFGTMKGYYKMNQATAEVIDPQGWLHTGDLAVMNEAGYCKITGRLKDMIIRGGENIYPREIEEFLYTHPKILDVQVIGIPSKRYGEEVMAVIRLKEEVTLTAQEVKDFCKGQIARHKIPKYIQFVDSFPTTASGKVQKYILRNLAIKEYNLEEAANERMA